MKDRITTGVYRPRYSNAATYKGVRQVTVQLAEADYARLDEEAKRWNVSRAALARSMIVASLAEMGGVEAVTLAEMLGSDHEPKEGQG